MTHDNGFGAIVTAWEQVIDDLVGAGTTVANIYRDVYRHDERRSAPPNLAAPAGSAGSAGSADDDTLAVVSETVERSLRAARETYEEVTARLATSERPQLITRDVEDALRVSLSELGSTLTRLSEQVGQRSPMRSGETGRGHLGKGTSCKP